MFEQGEGQKAEGADEPVLPSQNEIDEHNFTHLPFRDWCPFCIRGRGLSSGHFARKTPEESQVPTISIDYCFLGDETTRDTDLPVLVVRDLRSLCGHIRCRPKELKIPLEQNSCSKT